MTDLNARIPAWEHTDQLRQFRHMLDSNESLRRIVGEIARFRIVVDANFVIGELNQMIRYPERGKTALQELISASVFEVVAPRWLEQEMKSAIPQYCERRNVNEEKAWQAWRELSKWIVWEESIIAPSEFNSIDPKDEPYTRTALVTEAIGILSKDVHIEAMGGNRLTLDFVFHCRNYARAKTVSVGIVVNGMTLGFVTLSLLHAAVSGVSTGFSKMPVQARWVVLFGLVLVLLFPGSRKLLLQCVMSALNGAATAGKEVLDHLTKLSYLAEEKGSQAEESLRKANSITVGGV